MPSPHTEKILSQVDQQQCLAIFKARFTENMHRHPNLVWNTIQERLEKIPAKIGSLQQMEITGGMPDVIGWDATTGEFLFVDCSPETPKGRVSLCFDGDALKARKEHKPKGSAMEMAAGMGVEILSEVQYRQLQTLGEFDLKTSSWVQTPANIRQLGGALFCDRRYGQVFLYHNGAQSYYAVRGFRALLRV